MTIFNFSKITALVALALSVSFCNSEEATRKRAMPDSNVKSQRESESGVVPFNLNEVQRLEALLEQVEPIVAEQLRQQKGSINVSLLIEQVIAPLEGTVLNLEYLTNLDNRYLKTESGIMLVPRLVTLFNQATILVYTENPELAKVKEVLGRLKNQIFWDCDQNNSGTCGFISFYRTADSNNIVRIVRILHDMETDEAQKLRLVYAAYDLSNRRLDENLRFMLLERMATSLAQERSGQINPQRLARDANLFANILKINIGEYQTNTSERYIALVRAANPWMLSRNYDTPQSPAMTELLRLAAQNLIYEQSVNVLPEAVNVTGPAGMPVAAARRLSPELKLAIESLYYRVGPDYEQGVTFQKENILGEWKNRFQQEDGSWKADSEIARLSETQKKVFQDITSMNGERIELYSEESKAILNNMVTDVQFPADEYFFLVHQIYYEHYNIDDAAAFWENTSKNQKRLMEAMLDLIRLQIVNNIVLTNTRMNKFYSESKDTKIIELLNESQKEAAEMRKAWNKVIDRSKTLKSFASRIVDQNVRENKLMVDKITNNVEALGKNIKYLVTYPNMYSLMHIFASQEMKDKIRTFFGDFEIDSQTVIEIFFRGGFSPLFNFGHDGNKLDATEIMYAFYYALTTEIFSTYSTNKNPLMKFSIEEFFRVVVKRLVLSTENTLEAARDNLDGLKKDYSNIVNSMQQICREERSAQAEEAQVIAQKKEQMGDQFDWQRELSASMKRRTRVDNRIPFLDMASGVYDPTSTKEQKVGKHLRNVYSTSINNVLKNLRADFQQRNIMAKILLEIYRQYSKQSGGADEIAQIVEAQFQDFRRLKAQYMGLFYGMYEEVDDCDWTFLKRDRDIRHAIMFREAQYWGQIFDDAYGVISSQILSQRNAVPRLLQIEREADASLIDEAEELQDVLNSETVQQQLNAVREKYMTASTDSIYPQAYRDRMGYTTFNANRITIFKLDVYARLKSHLSELFPGQYTILPVSNFLTEDIYKETDPRSVNFNWSGVASWNESQRQRAREEFISSGVKTFASFVPWSRASVDISIPKDKGNILVSLFKLHRMSINPDINCEDANLSQEVIARDCRKMSAAKIIDHYEQFIKFVNIDERDEIILKYLGEETKYGEGDYEALIKKQKEHRIYSYYDLIFRRIFSDETVDKPETTWFVPLLVGYVESYQKRSGSTFIFPFPEELEGIFLNGYRPWIDNYFELNREFLTEVKSRQVTPFKFKYRMGREFTVGEAVANDTSSTHLISPLIYGKFTGFIQQLNRDTNYYFRSTIDEQQNQITEIIRSTEAGQD